MKIAIAVGHDIYEQGAYGNAGISEFNFNDEFVYSLVAGDYLPKKHEYAVFYRDESLYGYTDKMIALHEDIDNWGAEVSIELHFNSFSDESVTGHEVLYCSEGGGKIAEKLDAAFDSNIGTSDRGIKKITGSDRGGGFCCRGKSYAIISEPFFGSEQTKFDFDGIMREELLESFYDLFESIEG